MFCKGVSYLQARSGTAKKNTSKLVLFNLWVGAQYHKVGTSTSHYGTFYSVNVLGPAALGSWIKFDAWACTDTDRQRIGIGPVVGRHHNVRLRKRLSWKTWNLLLLYVGAVSIYSLSSHISLISILTLRTLWLHKASFCSSLCLQSRL